MVNLPINCCLYEVKKALKIKTTRWLDEDLGAPQDREGVNAPWAMTLAVFLPTHPSDNSATQEKTPGDIAFSIFPFWWLERTGWPQLVYFGRTQTLSRRFYPTLEGGSARSPDSMHPCLRVDEIVRLIASELVASECKATAAALARCCKSFEDPVLDSLWENQESLIQVLKIFPKDAWTYRESDVCAATMFVL